MSWSVRPWTAVATVVAVALFTVAMSQSIYEATSPPWLSWHVLLRKAYSVAAFALVGYLERRALGENGRRAFALPCIAGVAAYSAAIEAGQFLAGSHEGIGWNVADTFCGALGGAIAVADRLVRRR